MQKILFLSILFASFNSYAQKLSKNEAINKVEKFIKQNGYTSERFIFDSQHFEEGILDGIHTENIEEILAKRKGFLHSKAVYANETENSFVIGFEYANIDKKENNEIALKGVIISKKNHKMNIFHEDIIVPLKKLIKKR